MTYIFWHKFAALRATPEIDVHDVQASPQPQKPEVAEFDEDGRRYVFRYPPFSAPRYTIDRERIFEYMKTHRLPDYLARQARRDARNAANFYEDVREIQTHTDVMPVVTRTTGTIESLESQVAELRMRRAV